jgi:hypothetical protein
MHWRRVSVTVPSFGQWEGDIAVDCGDVALWPHVQSATEFVASYAPTRFIMVRVRDTCCFIKAGDSDVVHVCNLLDLASETTQQAWSALREIRVAFPEDYDHICTWAEKRASLIEKVGTQASYIDALAVDGFSQELESVDAFLEFGRDGIARVQEPRVWHLDLDALAVKIKAHEDATKRYTWYLDELKQYEQAMCQYRLLASGDGGDEMRVTRSRAPRKPTSVPQPMPLKLTAEEKEFLEPNRITQKKTRQLDIEAAKACTQPPSVYAKDIFEGDLCFSSIEAMTTFHPH